VSERGNLGWNCPNCGAVQEETGRCWVCSTPSVACGTCRHVRRAVVGRISYCGVDKRRKPVGNDDVRPCWVAPVALQRSAAHSKRLDGNSDPAPRISWMTGGIWEGLEA
jgi:hypothetical protein